MYVFTHQQSWDAKLGFNILHVIGNQKGVFVTVMVLDIAWCTLVMS